MGTTVSRHPIVPIGYRVQQLGDGRYYPQLHEQRGWRALFLNGSPPTIASYETQDEAEEHCRRHARQNGGV